MKTVFLAAGLVSVLALTACDDGPLGNLNSANSVNTGPMGGTHRQIATATAPSAMTSDFAQKAAIGDMFEIETSRVAIQKARNAQVKNFAQMMVTDHNQMSAKLKAATPPGVALPAGLDAAHQAKLDALRNMPAGANFDRAYMNAQVEAHNEALALHQNYARNGDVAPLREVANTAVPVVEGHLRQARALAR